jgi:hypothetical protein
MHLKGSIQFSTIASGSPGEVGKTQVDGCSLEFLIQNFAFLTRHFSQTLLKQY